MLVKIDLKGNIVEMTSLCRMKMSTQDREDGRRSERVR